MTGHNTKTSNAPVFKTCVKIPVRFVDVDSMGHVNNANYLTYFEEARVAFFAKIPELDFRKFDPESGSKRSIIIAEILCRYESPIRLGETVAVCTGVTSVGRSSFVMEYEMAEESSRRPVATGRSVQVYFDYTENRPIPLTDKLKQAFNEIETDL